MSANVENHLNPLFLRALICKEIMSSRAQEIQQRKDQVLAITVGQYIKTVTPVSSSYIAKIYPSGVSSATVRNVLAELEEEGYLTHPHTSAGRMPTQKGYRYYVDHLLDLCLISLIYFNYFYEFPKWLGFCFKHDQLTDITPRAAS